MLGTWGWPSRGVTRWPKKSWGGGVSTAGLRGPSGRRQWHGGECCTARERKLKRTIIGFGNKEASNFCKTPKNVLIVHNPPPPASHTSFGSLFRSIPSLWRPESMPAMPAWRSKQQDYTGQAHSGKTYITQCLPYETPACAHRKNTQSVSILCSAVQVSLSLEPKFCENTNAFTCEEDCKCKNQPWNTTVLLTCVVIFAKNYSRNVPWSRIEVFLQTKIKQLSYEIWNI